MIPICPCTHRVLDIGEKNTGSRSGRARVGPGLRFFTFLGSGPKQNVCPQLPIGKSTTSPSVCIFIEECQFLLLYSKMTSFERNKCMYHFVNSIIYYLYWSIRTKLFYHSQILIYTTVKLLYCEDHRGFLQAFPLKSSCTACCRMKKDSAPTQNSGYIFFGFSIKKVKKTSPLCSY